MLGIAYTNGVLEGGPPGQNLRLMALSKEEFRPETFAGASVTFMYEGNQVVSTTLRQGNNERS